MSINDCLDTPEASQTNQKYYSFSNSPNASDNYESPISFACSDTSYDGARKAGVLMQELLSLDAARIPRVIFGAGKGSLHDVVLDNGKEKILGSWGLGFPQTDDCTVVKSGPNGDLAPASHNRLPQFQSILSLLKEAQLIHSMTYSLWLRDRDAKVGYILFGGVDQGKFSEPLIGLPVVPLPGRTTLDAWTIQMTSIELHGDAKVNHNELISMETPVVAMLDSGSGICKMPRGLAQKIFKYVNPKSNVTDEHGPLVSCDFLRSKKSLLQGITIIFGFGGPEGAKIQVPIHEFITVIQKKQKWPKPKMDEVCQLTGIEIWDQDFVRLGDTFLRSAYAVYDTESPGIALAQTRYTYWSRVLQINNNTIPYLHSVVGIVGQSTSTQTAALTTVTEAATLSTPTSTEMVTETTVYVTAPLSTPTTNASSNSTFGRRAAPLGEVKV